MDERERAQGKEEEGEGNRDMWERIKEDSLILFPEPWTQRISFASSKSSAWRAKAARVPWCASRAQTPISSSMLSMLVRASPLLVSAPEVHRAARQTSSTITLTVNIGAAGIIFPLIDTADQAAHAVSLCRYPYAGGARSLSPSALIAGLNDGAPAGTTHERVADRNVAVIVQIESALAIDNLGAIASVPGVDCLMLGPGDLRISLGLPSKKVGEFEDEKFEVALGRLLEVGEQVGVPLMTVAYKVAARNREWMRRFGVLVTSADLMALVKGMSGELVECRRALGMGEGS
jgi:2-keto-3-deoxy-L-rhamnonate aldolase RhmA